MEPECQKLQLTPELEAALFPKTPVMISAKFERSQSEETPPGPVKEIRPSGTENEQQYPII